MPRTARKYSAFNLYHVILRGINRQIIFEEENDYVSFLSILKYYKEEVHFKLYAYCLMDNHIHLLIEPKDEELSETMKRIEIKFARWYNTKYERVGYLFQNRFKSEPINDEKYLLTVFRYIHQNPIRARAETEMGNYLWTSYQYYVKGYSSWIDIEKMFSYFDSQDSCIQFLNVFSNETCMEHFSSRYLPDDEAIKIIHDITSCKSATDLQKLDVLSRNAAICELMDFGLTMRQLSRLTGISRGVITKVIGDSKKTKI